MEMVEIATIKHMPPLSLLPHLTSFHLPLIAAQSLVLVIMTVKSFLKTLVVELEVLIPINGVVQLQLQILL